MFGNKSGFTLIELALATALSLLVALSLCAGLRGALKINRSLEDMTMIHQEARVSLDQIANEFRNAIDAPQMEWSSDPGSFTLAVPRHVVSSGESVDEQTIIQKVTYQLRPSPQIGETEQSVNEGSPKVLEKITQEIAPDSSGDPLTTQMTFHPTELTLEYAYASARSQLEWRSQWMGGPGQMPVGIRIHLTIYDERSNPAIFIRTVFRPESQSLSWIQ